jgi:hypothetical protein
MTKATPRAGRRAPHPARAADNGDGGQPTSGRRPRKQPPRSVTISSIAESAGVSVPTVSKVINGRSGVSPDTRARVEAAINEYGYRRPEPSKRRDLMELVFPELDHMWGLDIIRGVERVARQHGVGLVLSEFGPQRSAGRDWIDEAPPPADRPALSRWVSSRPRSETSCGPGTSPS